MEKMYYEKEGLYFDKTITMGNVVEIYAEKIAEYHNISKKQAKEIFLNSLLYNIVSNEVYNHVNFLITGNVE